MQLSPFETLADPTRRRIVELLRGGETPVGEIVDQVGIHQSGVSRHLRILAQLGFALRDEPLRKLLRSRGDSEAILLRLRALEEQR